MSFVSICSLHLHIKPGQLVAVVGQVGAGKSSLISSLLGDMERLEGSITLRVIGYNLRQQVHGIEICMS